MLVFAISIVASPSTKFPWAELFLGIYLMAIGQGFQASRDLLVELRMKSKCMKIPQGALVRREESSLITIVGSRFLSIVSKQTIGVWRCSLLGLKEGRYHLAVVGCYLSQYLELRRSQCPSPKLCQIPRLHQRPPSHLLLL
jgi:hypothetical protein